MEHEACQQAQDYHFWNFFLSKMRIISIILSSDEEYSWFASRQTDLEVLSSWAGFISGKLPTGAWDVCEIHHSGKIITQKVWTTAERCGRGSSRKPTFVGTLEHHYSQTTWEVHLQKMQVRCTCKLTLYFQRSQYIISSCSNWHIYAKLTMVICNMKCSRNVPCPPVTVVSVQNSTL